jgi:RNA polymerase sigma factor (sigma-70 family)
MFKALNRYDEDKNVKRSSWCSKIISQDIKSFINKNKFDLTVPECHQDKIYKLSNKEYVPAESFVRLEALPNNKENKQQKGRLAIPSGAPPPEQKAMVEEQSNTLLEELNKLPAREREIINLHYFNNLTLQQIGDSIGLSKQRVSQLEKKAFETLRFRLKPKIGEEILRYDGLARC